MKSLKQWLKALLHLSSPPKTDPVDEALAESFPASDPPAWAGGESQNTTAVDETTSDPLAILKAEHRAIMQVIYLMHEQIERLQQHQPAQLSVLTNITGFLRQFAEKKHHHKEEKLLLPALEQSGAPLRDCPVTLLKQDHETSLALLTTLEKLLPVCEKNEALIREQLLDTLNQLKDIYTRHMLKEENFIFPLVEKYLSPGKQKSLAEAFDKMDRRN